MKRNRNFWTAAALTAACFAVVAGSAQAQNPEPVWTGTGCTLTPDEASAGKYALGTGAQFAFTGAAVGTIEGRINIASQADDATPVKYTCLQVCFLDQNAAATRVRVYVYRVGSQESCCSSTLIASLDSNAYPAALTCQSQTVGINPAYQVFDFVDYAYFVYVQVTRNNVNYAPAFYTARLMPCGAFSAPIPGPTDDPEGLDSDMGMSMDNGAGSPPTAQGGAILELTPNPSRHETAIRYTTQVEGPVTLQIFDVGGRLVRTLVHEDQAPRDGSVRWDCRDEQGRECAHGVYFVRLNTRGSVSVERQLILTR